MPHTVLLAMTVSKERRKGNDVIFAVLGASIITIIILASLFYQEEPVERVERTKIMMGTFVTIIAYDTLKEAEDAIAAAFERIREVSDAASTYDENAEAYRLNRDGIIHNPSDNLYEIINSSIEYHRITNGSFDITLKPLLDLWQFRPWQEAHYLFDLDSNSSSEFDNNTISEEIREVFENHNYPLSEDALVFTADTSGWLIEESLFTLSADQDLYLENGSVNKALKEAFSANDRSLTSKAVLNRISPNRWNLTDGRKKFMIEDSEEHIVVAVEKFGIIRTPDRLNVTTQFWDLDPARQQEDITAKKYLLGTPRIRLSTSEIRLEEGMEITLGGIAKGYAVDEAIKVLREMGIRHGMVNAGGDIATIGSKPDGAKWTVALENPKETSEYITKFEIDGRSVCTSGNYHRYFDPEAKVGHIMDPRTGFSVDECMSVTIITDDCTTADVLATSVFVMGPVAGMELIDGLEGVEGLIIDANKTIHRSQDLIFFENK